MDRGQVIQVELTPPENHFRFCIQTAMNTSAMVLLIGKMDRLLSEMLLMAECNLDLPDQQTLKHHAEDMVGAATKTLKILEVRRRGREKARKQILNGCGTSRVAGRTSPKKKRVRRST